MIGVIADDLTGAAEIGAVGLRHGLRAEVVVTGAPSGHADLVCLDTDSRSCPPAEAAQRAANAAFLLQLLVLPVVAEVQRRDVVEDRALGHRVAPFYQFLTVM